jgi:hypothetical protein
MDAESQTPPLACDMAALGPAQRERHAALVDDLSAARLDVRAARDGYAVRLAADTAHILAAAEFISLERLCCPFLTLGLESLPDGTLWLRLAAPPGARDIIRAELPSLLGESEL